MPTSVRRDLSKTLRRLDAELARVQRQRDRAHKALESVGYGTYEYTQAQREYSRLCGTVATLSDRIASIERAEEW